MLMLITLRVTNSVYARLKRRPSTATAVGNTIASENSRIASPLNSDPYG